MDLSLHPVGKGECGSRISQCDDVMAKGTSKPFGTVVP